MSDFIHKLFSSYKERTDGDTLTGELNRIWYDSKTNTFRIQLDNTPGGTVISGGGGGNYTLPVATSTVLGGVKIGANISINSGVISVAAPFSGSYTDLTNKPTIPSLTGYATLTGEETLTNKTLTSPTITDGVFQDTFSIGNQVFYEHGYNGFSVNENFDIVGAGNFTGYHFTSGAGRDGVAFTLARTGQFTTGFGIHGTSSANEYVIGSETANTDFVFKSSIGMPFDVSGGTELLRISNTGTLTFAANGSYIQDIPDDENPQGLFINVNSNLTQFDTGGRTHFPNDLVIGYGGITFADNTYQDTAWSLARLAWNSAIDTELTVDDYRFRVSNQGGIFPQVISNTSGSKNLGWTAVGAISGVAVTQVGSTGSIVANNAWTTLYNSHGMDAAGDTVTVTLQDKNQGRIYRVTFMRSDNGTTTGYNIIAERLL